MKQNQDLNNTCILFDKEDEAQQKAIIKFYVDNGFEAITPAMIYSNENAIGVNNDIFNYWYYSKWSMMKVIELPSEYYPKIVESETTPEYQNLFNLMINEHNLILTISEMDEIIIESQKISNPIVESESNNGWISVLDRTPDLIENENYSTQVFVLVNNELMIMCYCYNPSEDESERGYFWANCYGNINGDAEFDDEYEVTHWQEFPKPFTNPKVNQQSH